MPQITAAELVVAVGMVVACYTDVRTTKIRNWLTFPMMVLGLAVNTSLLGWEGFVMAITGLLSAFVFYFIMAALGVLAPGDGKLMMGVGALTGTAFMFEATVASMALFIPVGFGFLIARGRLKSLGHTALYLYRRMALGDTESKAPEQTYIPHALTLTAGTALAWSTSWFDVFT